MTNKKAIEGIKRLRQNHIHVHGGLIDVIDNKYFNMAIEALEKQDDLISQTLEIVGEYVDDCIFVYDVEMFDESVKMIPVETIHLLLERIEKEATERSVKK